MRVACLPVVALCCIGARGQDVEAGRRSSSAKPLLRDCDVGYLLNCSCRAIRAYPWQKRAPLPGWETDDRGGLWESNPAGSLPDQFGFHVDWFRLHDTSTDHAVTIRHQIARQTSGIITWEFRFAMPKIMEGAAWPLCDMKAAAVSTPAAEPKSSRPSR